MFVVNLISIFPEIKLNTSRETLPPLVFPVHQSLFIMHAFHGFLLGCKQYLDTLILVTYLHGRTVRSSVISPPTCYTMLCYME